MKVSQWCQGICFNYSMRRDKNWREYLRMCPRMCLCNRYTRSGTRLARRGGGGCPGPLESWVLPTPTHPQVYGFEFYPSGSTRPQVDVSQDRSAVVPCFAGSLDEMNNRPEPMPRTRHPNADNVLIRHSDHGTPVLATTASRGRSEPFPDRVRSLFWRTPSRTSIVRNTRLVGRLWSCGPRPRPLTRSSLRLNRPLRTCPSRRGPLSHIFGPDRS